MLALVGLSLVATWGAPEAHARRRKSGKATEYRFRLSGAYGGIDYKAESFATNTRTALATQNFGARLQAEAWLSRSFGFMFDSEMWYVGVSGSDIYYYYFNLPLALRIFGEGGAMASETVVYAGPSFSIWPDVRAYFRTTNYDLVNPKDLGVNLGVRWRVAVAPGYTVELGANYTAPFKLVGTPGSTLSTTETRTVGGTILVDYRYYEGMGVALGYMYELNRMAYVPAGNVNNSPQTINVDVSAGFVSLRFWF